MKSLRIGALLLIVGCLVVAPLQAAPGSAPGILLSPANMEYVGQGPRDAWALDQHGSYVYLIAAEGLSVEDVTNPAAPVEVGFLPLTSTAWNVVISGTLAYIAGDWQGLVIADVSDPAHPEQRGSLGFLSGSAMSVALQGQYAYVAGSTDGLRVIDVSEPANPTEIGSLPSQSISQAVAVQARYAYLADYEAGLRVIDVQDPAHPVQTGQVRGPVDPSDPNYWTAQAVSVQGYYAYVLDWDKLHVMDISNPANPVEVAIYDTPGQAYRIAVEGIHAYVADYDSGVSVLNIANPLAPVQAGFYDTNGESCGIDVSGDLVYVADGAEHLIVLRFLAGATGSPVDVSLTSSRNPSFFPDAVTFRATVSALAPGAGTPTGDVQFKIDGAAFGAPVALVGGVATSAAISTLALGNHLVTARYLGSAFFPGDAPALTQRIMPRLTLKKTAEQGTVPAGWIVRYTLRVTNASSSTATIMVTDTLPAGVTYVSADPAGYTRSGRNVVWRLRNVPAGGVRVLHIAIRTYSTARGRILNLAEASSGGFTVSARKQVSIVAP